MVVPLARFKVGVQVALLIAAMTPRVAAAHPLHTTITEIVEDRAHGKIRATVRVFMDDLETVVRKSTHGRVSPASGAAWDAATQAYVKSTFGLRGHGGASLPLESCGVKRTADLLWFCYEATDPGVTPLDAFAFTLFDLYEDQVNVVQATMGGARSSLLFTRGDKPKRLR